LRYQTFGSLIWGRPKTTPRRISSGPIADLEPELMKKVYRAVLEVIGINLFTA
jgi:hypothetical protein